MTTFKPNDPPDEPTAVATAQAETEGVDEAEGKPEPAATTAERILTSAPSPRGSAVPSAVSEPEADPEEPERREETEEPEEMEVEADPVVPGATEAAPTSAQSAEPETSTDGSSAQSAAAEPTAETAADTRTAESADTKTAESADTSIATGDTAAASDDAMNSSAKTAVKAVPGRPHKSLLAGAAIVGALLISVPFLISGGNGEDERSSTKQGTTPGTVLGGLAGAVPGAVGSESPSPHVSGTSGKKVPKTVTTTGPNGKPITVTAAPEPVRPTAGKKSSTGGRTTATTSGSGKSAAGEKSSTGGKTTATSSGSGKAATHSGTPSGTTTKAPPPSDPWPGGMWIYGHASGRCIGIAGSPGAATGSALVIWDCYDVSYQRWKFVNGTVRSEGKCMNVQGGARGDGAVINWTTCNGSGAQQFRLNAAHDLTNPQSGNKCVDVKDLSTANGARLQLWTCAGTPNQKWSTRTP
ncbi:ricin-type beta-trefoil lectin domain protein [Streptomyces sp. NPDC001020]